MNFKILLVEKKVFCPACNNELHIVNLMFEDESNGKIVCGYCRDDYETYILTGVLAGELRKKRDIKPWGGKEAIVIDGHFDNPKREWNGVEQIMVKSKFNGWKKINKNEALEYAKWKINAITTGKTDEERLSMVNDCLRGIKFSLKDLLCQE